jgi:hypothetical protein
MGRCGLGTFVSGQGAVVGCFEHGNEISGSIEWGVGVGFFTSF